MDKIKLHLGCGMRDFGEDWDHVDAIKAPHIKSHDVTKLAYKTGSVSMIYASHLIAYFSRQEIIPILKEWRRVLKPKGVLRVSTPDWDALRKIRTPLTGPLYGKMGEPAIYHKTVYSFESLKTLLDLVGFYRIKRFTADTDDCSAAEYEGQLISLNIECIA